MLCHYKTLNIVDSSSGTHQPLIVTSQLPSLSTLSHFMICVTSWSIYYSTQTTSLIFHSFIGFIYLCRSWKQRILSMLSKKTLLVISLLGLGQSFWRQSSNSSKNRMRPVNVLIWLPASSQMLPVHPLCIDKFLQFIFYKIMCLVAPSFSLWGVAGLTNVIRTHYCICICVYI